MDSSAVRLKRGSASGIACAVLVILSGCCIPGLRPAQPAASLPPDFNGMTAAQNSAELGVSEFFQDPLLTSLVAQALSGNQELRILDEEVQIAANDVLLRRGAYWPFLNLRADAGVEKPSLYTPLGAAEDQLLTPQGRNFPDPLGNFRVGADFFWQIDIWRELRNARDAAAQRYAAALERRNYFVTTMVAEIAENYFELMALDQRLQILDQIIGLQEQSLRTAELNKNAGRDTELPVQRFDAEVRKNRSEKLIVAQEIIQAENRINFLRGTFPQPVPRSSANFFDLNLQAVQMGIPAQLLQYRTDIRRAERELAAAGLDVLVARAHFYPRLDITGSIGFEAFEPRFLFDPEAFVGNVAGGLVQPLINLRAIQAEYQSANARQLQALYNYQRTILNAFTEVVNNLAKADNYRQSVEIKKQQLSALSSSVDLATKLFQSNRAEYIDVLFSQRDLLDARSVLIDTKLQELSAIVSAYQALGGGLLLSNSPQFPAELFNMEAQPDPGPALPPAEKEDAGGDGAASGSGDESAGRATVAIESLDAQVSPLFGGRQDVDARFNSPDEGRVTSQFDNSGLLGLFDLESDPDGDGQSVSPFSAQLDAGPAGTADEDQPRPMPPAVHTGYLYPGDEDAGQRDRTVIKAGVSANGPLNYISRGKSELGGKDFSAAPDHE